MIYTLNKVLIIFCLSFELLAKTKSGQSGILNRGLSIIRQSVIINDSKYNGFPTLDKTADGKLIVYYREGSTHSSYDGKIVYQLSNDRISWGSKNYLASPPVNHDYRPGCLKVLSNGNWIATYNDHTTTALSTPYIYIAKSTNEGNSWDTNTIQPFNKGSWPSGDILEHSSGVLIMSIHGWNIGDTQSDHLRTGVVRSINWSDWSEPILISNTDKMYQEATLIELPNGTIRAFIRDQTTNPSKIRCSDSSDVGLTWSVPIQLSFYVWPGMSRHILIKNSQVMIVGYREKNNGFCAFRYSYNGWETWSNEAIYFREIGEYMGSCKIDDNTVGYAVAHCKVNENPPCVIEYIEFKTNFLSE